MFAQWSKTSKDYRCHTVCSYTENPPLHFNFSGSLLMIIIYSSLLVITQKQNLDSCITKLFFSLIKSDYLVTCLFIYSIDIDNIEQFFFFNYFLLMQPIQFNFSVAYRLIYVCVFPTRCPINRDNICYGRKDKGQILILKKHIKVCLIQGWCRLSCFSR